MQCSSFNKFLRRCSALPEPILPFLLGLQSLRRFLSKEIKAADEERLPTETARLEYGGAGRGFVEPNDHFVRMWLWLDFFHDPDERRGFGLRLDLRSGRG